MRTRTKNGTALKILEKISKKKLTFGNLLSAIRKGEGKSHLHCH